RFWPATSIEPAILPAATLGSGFIGGLKRSGVAAPGLVIQGRAGNSAAGAAVGVAARVGDRVGATAAVARALGAAAVPGSAAGVAQALSSVASAMAPNTCARAQHRRNVLTM